MKSKYTPRDIDRAHEETEIEEATRLFRDNVAIGDYGRAAFGLEDLYDLPRDDEYTIEDWLQRGDQRHIMTRSLAKLAEEWREYCAPKDL